MVNTPPTEPQWDFSHYAGGLKPPTSAPTGVVFKQTLPAEAPTNSGTPRPSVSEMAKGIGDIAGEGAKSMLTAQSYLQWIKMGTYPWFWGPIRGLGDVQYMLEVTMRLYADAKYLAPAIKAAAQYNLSAAWAWVREEQARAAQRSGGPPISH